MHYSVFQPLYLNATSHDFSGNHGIGRYVLLTSSNDSALSIANQFENVTVKQHARGHTLYLGSLNENRRKIDIAALQINRGCASLEIILHELFNLGAKRFLRLDIASSLQPNLIKTGDIINVQASVRDDGTSSHYAPLEFPSMASLEFITSILVAAEKLQINDLLHTGIVHSKTSEYSREVNIGPRATQNKAYLSELAKLGTLASEMDTATLFIQSQLYNCKLIQQGDFPHNRVLAGAILNILEDHSAYGSSPCLGMEESMALAIESIKVLAGQEL